MKRVVLLLAVMSTLAACVHQAPMQGKVVGSSHGTYFANPQKEHVPVQHSRLNSHGGEW